MIELPLTKMTVHARTNGQGGPSEHGIYEGEASMTQQQADQYKAIIGDGQAKVTAGRDISEKDYGNGGGVFVNVTLTCDQSEGALQQAIALASNLANGAAWHYHAQLKADLVTKGVLR